MKRLHHRTTCALVGLSLFKGLKPVKVHEGIWFWEESMKASPMHPSLEAGNYCSYDYEFDPQADFNQFLEEAKSRAYEANFKTVTQHVGDIRNIELDGEKRNRKSWKSSVFSWLKMDKRNKTIVEPSDGSTFHPKVRRGGMVSGPMHSSSGGITSRSRKPTSGPLMSLFNPSKREEDGIVPYMCLNQLNNPHDVHSYGPVYLVT